ncbi:MAG: SDR family oxidoreductase [Oscillospiraceae bacterium]|nr:SDR family oxidoreductase [Oscillospiraceae bacterium]
MNLFDLTGKCALVTGGSRGLGLAMTKALCMAGAKVAIIATSEQVFHVADELCGAGFSVVGVKCDLADADQLEAGFEEALAKLGGRLDILVNNAAINRRGAAEDYAISDWDYILDLNLRAVFRLSQLAGRHMLERGSGKIINIASLAATFGSLDAAAYSASKGALVQMSKSLSNEWAGRGINVNVIAPGWTVTEATEGILTQDKARTESITARIPKGRWGRPADMMGVTLLLASDASDFITGAVIPVDGGFTAR